METRKPARERDTTDRRREGIESPVEGFNERGGRAARDEALRGALRLFATKVVPARNATLAALPEAPELRERAYRIKRETMANLDRYLEEMAEAVEARGGSVHFASDGEDVVRYVGELARRRGAKVIAKSKSMATEEIELNRRLEEGYADLGLEIVETDLGEWIAQLAGDTPSHIIGPILHMNAERVAEILSEVAGEELPPDATVLSRFARGRLREKFLTADIGITGANFGVAESGTVVTVTNEGNGRLVTSVPPVHVVVMGIEKMIPRFEDLSVFTRLLARSGTGQKLTVYTNFVTGPRGPGELDGAEEFHLVLLDNGRSNLLGTPFEEALYCIRCGSCLNVCPVYRQTGGHAYGSTYSGPIGAVITPLLKGDEEAKDLPHASSLCGACSETCPVGIPLHDLLLKLRNRQVEEGMAGKTQTAAFKVFENTMKSPALYNISGKLGRAAQRPLVREGTVRPVPGPLRGWTGSRELPPLAPKPFRELWRGGI
ncbi:iron-sulfur cluster-binding protein [Rubrobacter marinus]|uniref:Iron-sulfur cluster-binding protein n=1 Tax=Rubrobacter marinus TaxID=2653852 RepID=A0A6G8PWI6_9ACTN|nr:LutB/LldF family L-lactate oxidation iron-sulfur protein [Rubrobacter marinus]QIN78581.1 iron-sulfur cluster-binding protein [Rubrobacter marinus]